MSCISPIKLKNEGIKTDFTHHLVPCGKCHACLARHSRGWIFRLKQELKVSASAHFVTFTYEDNQLIWTNNGAPTLHKQHLKDYFRELRRQHKKERNDGNIPRYYAVGEYGTQTKRPHYHAIIFNAYEDEIVSSWEHGICHVGTVTEDSIAYTTKYLLKELKNFETTCYHSDPSFQKSFSLMSKGIGKNYSDNENIKKYHKDNLDRPYMVDEKGFKYSMPRYYKDKIYTEEEQKVIRKLQQKRLEQEQLEDTDHSKERYENDLSNDVQKIYLFNKRLKASNKKL